jgi:membrane protein
MPSDQATAAAATLRPTLPRRFGRLSVRVWHGMFEHHAFDHAAAMSFYFFLGLVPLLGFAGFVVGEYVHAREMEELLRPLFRMMPHLAVELIRTTLREIAESPDASLGPLSLAGFLILTSNGIHNLMDVFELVAKAAPRPWWKQRLIALAGVGVSLLVMACAATVALLLFRVGRAHEGGARAPGLLAAVQHAFAHGWSRVGVLLLFFGLSACGIAAFYRLGIRHARTIRRRVWPGTLVAIMSWTAVTALFGAYVRELSEYALFYGSLAAVAILLIWLYLSSLSFFLGAEVNAQLEGVRGKPPM